MQGKATLATMVDYAYVNHIPVLTGGCGKAALRDFYSRRFIPAVPPDSTLTPIYQARPLCTGKRG